MIGNEDTKLMMEAWKKYKDECEETSSNTLLSKATVDPKSYELRLMKMYGLDWDDIQEEWDEYVGFIYPIDEVGVVESVPEEVTGRDLKQLINIFQSDAPENIDTN